MAAKKKTDATTAPTAPAAPSQPWAKGSASAGNPTPAAPAGADAPAPVADVQNPAPTGETPTPAPTPAPEPTPAPVVQQEPAAPAPQEPAPAPAPVQEPVQQDDDGEIAEIVARDRFEAEFDALNDDERAEFDSFMTEQAKLKLSQLTRSRKAREMQVNLVEDEHFGKRVPRRRARQLEA